MLIDTHQKSLELLLQLDAIKNRRLSRPTTYRTDPFVRDPYHRRQRKYARGTPNPYRPGLRAQAERIHKAQMKIEAALRASGASWRALEKECKGRWSNAADACKSLLNENALKVLTA